MIEFSGLANASGLRDGQQAILTKLLDVRSNVLTRNKELVDYFNGDITVSDFGISIDSSELQNDFCSHWPERAVMSLAERERFDGFVFENNYTDANLQRAIANNNMLSAYMRYNTSKLVQGVMFACVNKLENGDAQVRFHSADTAWAIPDENFDSGNVGAGFAVSRIALTPYSSGRQVPIEVNFYEPGRVTVITRTSANQWKATPYDVPNGEMMMFAFVHGSSGIRPFGRSRITPAVKSLTRAAVRTTWHMMLSGAFYAAPKYAVLSLTDKQFDAMSENKQKFYMDAMLLFTKGKDGTSPTVQQFSGNSPQPFIEELEYYAGQLCGATGIPMANLVDTGHYTSADAMSAAGKNLVIAARDDITADSRTLRKIALLVMAISENKTVDELTDEQKTVTAHFLAPDMPSRSQLADATIKNIQALPWLAETDLALENLGYEQADIMRVRKARDAYTAATGLESIFARLDAENANEPIETNEVIE